MSEKLFSLIQNQTFKRVIFFIPIAVIFLIILTKILFGVDNEFYQKATEEDGPIEYATAIAYFISFIFSLAIARFFKERKKFFILFLILSLGFLFIALEEISWGQRIFDIKAPKWFPYNTQREITIHNLEIFIQYRHAAFMIVAFIGSFTWFVLPKIHTRLFEKVGNGYRTFLRYAVPSKYLISYFLPIFLLWIIYDLTPQNFINRNIRWNFFIWYDSEPLELMLSIGILLFVMNSYFKLRSSRKK